MKNIGVICEYNPFHNGHAKQLRAMRQEGTAICLMSGSYVQRGEPAILDKYTRAKAAVLCGADLVLELPLIYALSSAEGFADGGVEIFARLGCVDALCFGSESGEAEPLMQLAQLLLSEEFPPLLRRELDKGLSFPKARQLALEMLGAEGALLEQPNNILAVEYCKALLRRGSAIAPMVLRREGSYHESQERENPSASVLRTRESWEGFVPAAAQTLFDSAPRYSAEAGERAWLARLRAMSEAEFEALPYGSEGLWRKLLQACRTQNSIQGILTAVKSKRYPMTRLKRMLLCAYLGITEPMLRQEVPYLRVLAMNERGQALLRKLRKQSGIELLHAGEEAPRGDYAELERRAEDLHGLFACAGILKAGLYREARLFRAVDSV